MSVLLLIRHGQASFEGADYDVLSPLGERQAELLGRYLAHPARRPDVLYCGPRRRQRDTARILCEALGAELQEGVPPVVQEPLVALDEYPVEAVIRRSLPVLVAEHPEVAAWFAPQGGLLDPLRDRRAFEHIFRLAMRRWVGGALVSDEVGDRGAEAALAPESFAAFAGRVRGALETIMAQEGARRRVAVVTSAGPVAVGAQLALALPGAAGSLVGAPSDEVALHLSWVVQNASLTELRYRAGEVGLISFNTAPHLPQPELISYR